MVLSGLTQDPPPPGHTAETTARVSSIVAGSNVSVAVLLRDALGNVLVPQSFARRPSVLFTVHSCWDCSSLPTATMCQCRDSKLHSSAIGSWHAGQQLVHEQVMTVSGIYRLQALLPAQNECPDDVPCLPWTSFLFEVLPSQFNPLQSAVFAPNTSKYIAGDVLSFDVSLRDNFGNAWQDEAVKVMLSAVSTRLDAIPCEAKGNGAFACRNRLTLAEPVLWRILANGHDIPGSPLRTSTAPGPVTAKASFVSVSGLMRGVAREATSVFVTVRDKHLNPSRITSLDPETLFVGDMDASNQAALIFQSYRPEGCEQSDPTSEACQSRSRFAEAFENNTRFKITEEGGPGIYRIQFVAADAGSLQFQVLLCDASCCTGSGCPALAKCAKDESCDTLACSVQGNLARPCNILASEDGNTGPFAMLASNQYHGTRAEHTVASTAMESTQTAGSDLSFRIEAKDEYDVAAPSCDDSFIVRVHPRSHHDSAIFTSWAVGAEACAGGVYSPSFRMTRAGHYRVEILMGDEAEIDGVALHIRGSPFSSTVLPAQTSEKHSHSDALSIATAGVVSTFLVHPVDVYGNNQMFRKDQGLEGIASTDAIDLRLDGPSLIYGWIKHQPECTERFCSPFEMEYLATVAGTYEMIVRVNGLPMEVHSITVLPNKPQRPCISMSQAFSVVGEPVTVSVILTDEFGNTVKASSEHCNALNVSILPEQLNQESEHISAIGKSIECAVSDEPDHPNVISFIPTNPGQYSIIVTHGEDRLSSSPVPLVLRAAGTVPVVIRSLHVITAGDVSTVSIQARECSGRSLQQSTYDVQIVGDGSTVYPDLHYVDQCELRYQYVVTQAGRYSIQVASLGSAIETIGLVVQPSACSAAMSTLSCVSQTSLVVNSRVDCHLSARDPHGNDVTPEESDVTVRTLNSSLVLSPLTRGENGVFSFSVHSEMAGNSVVAVALNGSDVRGSPLSLVFAPAAIDARRSRVHTDSADIIAGQPMNLRLEGRDTYDNLVHDCGQALRLDFAGSNLPAMQVRVNMSCPEVPLQCCAQVTTPPAGSYVATVYLIVGEKAVEIGGSLLRFKARSEEIATRLGMAKAVLECSEKSVLAGGSASFSAFVSNAAGLRADSCASNSSAALLSVDGSYRQTIDMQCDKGTYTGPISVTVSGQYELTVSLDGHQTSAPFEVLAGAVDLTRSMISGGGLESAMAGEVSSFELHAKDFSGNAVACDGGWQLSAQYTTGGNVPMMTWTMVQATVLVFFTAPHPGELQTSISCGGVALSGSPFTTSVIEKLPPIVQSAVMSASFRSVELTFDIDIGSPHSLPCEELFDAASVRLLGPACIALRKSARRVVLHLSAHATLLPGDELTLSTCRTGTERSSFCAQGSVRIEASTVETGGIVHIDGPDTLSVCDELVLHANAAAAIGRAPWRYTWYVTSTANVHDHSLMTFLHHLPANASLIAVPKDLLQADSLHNFSVVVTDGAGRQRHGAKAVTVVETHVPVVFFSGPHGIEVRASEQLALHAHVKASSCSKAPLLFKWQYKSISVGTTHKLPEVDGPTLVLDRYKLNASDEYDFKLTVLDAALPQIATVARMRVRTTEEMLKVHILGGNRLVSAGEDVNLTAVVSRNLSNTNRKVRWGCTPHPCFFGASSVLGTEESLLVQRNTMAPGAYRFSVSVLTEQSEARSSAVIYVSPGRTAQVMIDSRPVISHPSESVALRLSSGNEASLLGFVCSLDSLPLSVKVPIDSTLSILPLPLLAPGTEHRVRLIGSHPHLVSMSELRLSVGAAPWGGSFVVSPTSGSSLDTRFSLSAESWVDELDNFPISFCFSFQGDPSDIRSGEELPATFHSQRLMGCSFSSQLRTAVPDTGKGRHGGTSQFRLVVRNVIGSSVDTASQQILIRRPSNPMFSAQALTVEMHEAVHERQLDAVLRAAGQLASLVSSSTCREECDRNELRAVALSGVKSCMPKTSPLLEHQAEMVGQVLADSVHDAAAMNASTIAVALSLTRDLVHRFQLGVFPRRAFVAVVDTLGNLMRGGTNPTSQLPNARLFVSDVAELTLSAGLAGASQLALGSSSIITVGPSVRVMASRINPLHSAHLPWPAFTEGGGVSLPAGAFDDGQALQVVVVEWKDEAGALAPLSLVTSRVVSTRFVLESRNGSLVQLTRGLRPIRVSFPKEKWVSSMLHECRWWESSANSTVRRAFGPGAWGKASAVVESDGAVTCSTLDFTEVTTVLRSAQHPISEGTASSMPAVTESSRHARDGTTPWIAGAVLIIAYFVCVWLADRADRAAELQLTQRISTRRGGGGGEGGLRSLIQTQGSSESGIQPTEQQQRGAVDSNAEEGREASGDDNARARDYLLIKATLRDRMDSRLQGWIGRARRVVRGDHPLVGLLHRPLFSAYTRPRRVTSLFTSLATQLVLSACLARCSANVMPLGLLSAVISLPIGMLFATIFRRIHTPQTLSMRKRRRLQDVRQSLVLSKAFDLLPSARPTPSPTTQDGASSSAAAAPPARLPPEAPRPRFVRRAQPRPPSLSQAASSQAQPTSALPASPLRRHAPTLESSVVARREPLRTAGEERLRFRPVRMRSAIQGSALQAPSNTTTQAVRPTPAAGPQGAAGAVPRARTPQRVLIPRNLFSFGPGGDGALSLPRPPPASAVLWQERSQSIRRTRLLQPIDEGSELGRGRGDGVAVTMRPQASQSEGRSRRRGRGEDTEGSRVEDVSEKQQAWMVMAPPTMAIAAFVVAVLWIVLCVYIAGIHGVALCGEGQGRIALMSAWAAASAQDLLVVQLGPLLAALCLRQRAQMGL